MDAFLSVRKRFLSNLRSLASYRYASRITTLWFLDILLMCAGLVEDQLVHDARARHVGQRKKIFDTSFENK